MMIHTQADVYKDWKRKSLIRSSQEMDVKCQISFVLAFTIIIFITNNSASILSSWLLRVSGESLTLCSPNNAACLSVSPSLSLQCWSYLKERPFPSKKSLRCLLLTHTCVMYSEFSLSWLVRDGKSTEQLFFQSGKFDFSKRSKKGLRWDVTCTILIGMEWMNTV